MRGIRQRLNFATTAGVVITALIVVAISVSIVSAATSVDSQTNAQKATEWCAQENGELYNENVVGSHGGLHCELQDGTTVHMHKIAEVGWTHDMDTIQATDGATHENTALFGFGWKVLGVVFVVFILVVFVYFASAFNTTTDHNV